MPKKNKTNSKIQGATRLVTEATLGITNVVEDMHQRLVHPPFFPSTAIQNVITKIARLVYTNVRWTTKIVGNSIDSLLGKLIPLLGDIKSNNQKEAFTATLNGVIGDYLEQTNNPLQIRMEFRHKGQSVKLDHSSIEAIYPKNNGKLLLMIHGSSMNDLQWNHNNHNHGESIARDLNASPIYLHYNSGKHISTNGKELANLLEQLIREWPTVVEELIIISHSMGGLVARSAVYYGQTKEHSWINTLSDLIFLGTPHHGSPIEKAGNYVDLILEKIPYTKPLAPLGKIRSAGVTDLRFGNIIDEDWQGVDRFERRGDRRIHIGLPEKTRCYAIAASKGKTKKLRFSKIKGDGLVTVKSALGMHKNATKDLDFKEEHTRIIYKSAHIDLLSNQEVYLQLKTWLSK